MCSRVTFFIPSIWLKAIVCPIVKDSATDPVAHLSLNYYMHGISPLTVVGKKYNSNLNKMLAAYLDNMGGDVYV